MAGRCAGNWGWGGLNREGAKGAKEERGKGEGLLWSVVFSRSPRNRVFSRYFVDLPDSVKNPVSPSRTARNRVFSRYFVWARRFGQKPGFSVARPETGFFRDISFGPVDSAKNPVSQSRTARNRVFSRYFVWARRFGQKPGFSESQPLNPVEGARNRVFRDISFGPADSVKNPVSQSRTARNRVFSRYFVWARRFGQKPGFSESHGGQKPGFFEIFR